MIPLADLMTKEQPLEVLCIGAHSDDIEIGCGGTLLTLDGLRRDLLIHWVVLSAEGHRRDEATAGAELFRGGMRSGSIRLGGFRDGFFPFQGTEIKEFFEGLKTNLSPDLIFTHFRDDRHQDHRLVSDLTWNTWRDHTILEYEVPKWDGDLGTPNLYVGLSGEVTLQKINGIVSTFSSQSEKSWFSSETFSGLMRLRGNECRAPGGYAEAFHARKLRFL